MLFELLTSKLYLCDRIDNSYGDVDVNSNIKELWESSVPLSILIVILIFDWRICIRLILLHIENNSFQCNGCDVYLWQHQLCFTWCSNNFDFAFTFKDTKRCFQNYCDPWKYHCEYFSRQWHVSFVSVPGGSFNRMTFSFALERIFQSLLCLESRKPYNCQLQVSQMGNEEKTLKNIAATTTKKNKKIFQLIYQSNRIFFFLSHFREYE